MYVDPRTHTTATLYGNDAAMQTVQARRAPPIGGPSGPTYPAGAVLALVTWVERDDPHWFGARLPAAPESVEFVKVAGPGLRSKYRVFAGLGLSENRPTPSASAERTRFILELAPAQLP